MAKPRDTLTLDLFEWQPPQVAVRMPAETVRGGTLRTQIARAVSQALKECDRSRDEVAAAMSDYLNQEVSKNMLDAYASPSRDEHHISLERFVALIEATGSYGLLGFVADHFDHVVVPSKYSDLIELHMVEEQIERQTQRKQALQARWKSAR